METPLKGLSGPEVLCNHVDGCETPAYVPNSTLCPRHLYESRNREAFWTKPGKAEGKNETVRGIYRSLAWYGLRGMTAETLEAFERWQKETGVVPMDRTVVVETLPDGRRNYEGAFDGRDSYRVMRWLRDREIPVVQDTGDSSSEGITGG